MITTRIIGMLQTSLRARMSNTRAVAADTPSLPRKPRSTRSAA